MQLPIITLNSKNKIILQRILPIPGEVLVSLGQVVDASTVVAQAQLPGRYRIIEVARRLGILPPDMDEVMQVDVGATVEANQVIASRKGGFSLFSQSVYAPVAGQIAMIGPGWVLLESEHQQVELQAFIPGTVSRVLGQQGVLIESEGAMIEAACGFGGEICGRLKRLVDSPFEALQATAFDESASDMILLGGRTVDEEALRKADSWHVRGIIVGSIEANLLNLDPPVQVRVVATEGFGDIPMSPHTFGILTSLSRRDISIRGHFSLAGETSAGEWHKGPSIILAATAPQASVRSYVPAVSTLGNTQKKLEVAVGSRVRVTYGRFIGASGQVESIPSTPQAIETGIVASGAVIKFGNERHYIPWANLQQIDG